MTAPGTWTADCKTYLQRIRTDNRLIYRGVAEQILHGIKFGSGSSGAPGQPVSTGYLRNSWQINWGNEAEMVAQIGTPCAYARVIESGGNRAEYDKAGEAATESQQDLLGNPVNVTARSRERSTVGGPHSVTQTQLNFDRIVRNVRNEVVG